MDSFVDDTDLPDHHYESIYGRAAMRTRLLARLDALLKRMDERNAWLEEQTQRWDATRRKERPEQG